MPTGGDSMSGEVWATGMLVWHSGTQTLMDGDDVELLPKRYWGACECGTPFMLERADRCAFCEEEI